MNYGTMTDKLISRPVIIKYYYVGYHDLTWLLDDFPTQLSMNIKFHFLQDKLHH